jgi:anti-anti-sigma regulatory factor
MIMAIKTRIDAETKTLIIKPSKNFDATAYESFESFIKLIDPTIKTVLVDFQNTLFVDSAGLEMIEKLQKLTLTNQQILIVINSPAKLSKVG